MRRPSSSESTIAGRPRRREVVGQPRATDAMTDRRARRRSRWTRNRPRWSSLCSSSKYGSDPDTDVQTNSTSTLTAGAASPTGSRFMARTNGKRSMIAAMTLNSGDGPTVVRAMATRSVVIVIDRSAAEDGENVDLSRRQLHDFGGRRRRQFHDRDLQCLDHGHSTWTSPRG